MLHKKRKPSTFTSSSGFADCKRNTTSNNNMLHSKSTYFYRWLPISCSLAFLLGLGIMINPAINSTEVAHAETVKNILTDEALNSTVDLIMGDVLNEQVEVESGKVAYISNEFTVRVTGAAKYSISVQAAEGASSNLIGRNTGEQILGVGEDKQPSKFDDNTWGYAIANSTSTANTSLYYNPLPAYGAVTRPKYTKYYAENEEDILKLAFAAKITDYKPSDHYETKALLSVVAEPLEIIVPTKVEPTGLVAKDGSKTILNMQDITTDFCANKMNVGDTGTLMDTRDEKVYWVAKLADNNCWMTQNLDYNLSSAQTLTPANSDVTTSWTPSAAQNTKTGELSGWATDSTLVQSYDPGLYVIKAPAQIGGQLTCGGSQTNCDPGVLQNVSKGWKMSTSKSMSNSLNADELVYNAHYTLGNYYSYAAAVAGSVPSSGNANSSICPKGWKLPAGTGNTASGSFNYLLEKTGLSGQAVFKSPVFFIRSGWLFESRDSGNSLIAGIQLYTAYRSSTPGSALRVESGPQADTVGFGLVSGWAITSDDSGLPVRCVAK